MTDPRHRGSPSGHLRWEQALDALERAARRGADHEPPVDLPALPAGLEQRAREVMALVEARRSDLLDQRDAIGAELAQLTRASRSGPGRRSAPAGAAAAHRTYDAPI
jgi:hypothetical protein